MSPKLRRFVAIVALVFMGIFMVSAMMYFIDKTLLNNSVEFLMIFSGAIAISLYLVILFDNKFGIEGTKKRMEQAQKEQEEARLEYEKEQALLAKQQEEQSENADEKEQSQPEEKQE